MRSSSLPIALSPCLASSTKIFEKIRSSAAFRQFAEACHLQHLGSRAYRPTAVKIDSSRMLKTWIELQNNWKLHPQTTDTNRLCDCSLLSLSDCRVLVAIIIGKRHRNNTRSRCHEVDHFDDVNVMVVGLVRRRQCLM